MLYTIQSGLLDGRSPASLVTIGVTVMMLLAASIIVFAVFYQKRINLVQRQKAKQLVDAAIHAEEEERTRIAAELHDDVGTTLASVRLFLHAATMEDADPGIIAQSKELLDESIARVRTISHKLQPALLQRLGLKAALESFASMISKPGVVHMSCRSDELPRLAESIELSVYRIVQELTNNVIKHAEASSIAVEVLMLPLHLRVQMTHNGEGLTEDMFQQQLYKKGATGLKNIVNRLKSIAADITFEKTAEHTYSIIITVPLKQ